MDYYIKYKRKSVRILFIVCLVLVCVLSGCTRQEADKSDSKQVTIAPENPTEPISTDELDHKEEVTDDSIIADNDDKSDDMDDAKSIESNQNTEVHDDPNIEEFAPVEEYFIDYSFEISYDENAEYLDRVYNVQGEYDLDGDGKVDTINAVLKCDYSDAIHIEVNGLKTVVDHGGPSGEVKIIDLDKNDKYVEIVVMDNGLDSFSGYVFFQYDGKKLDYYDTIQEGSLIDGQGRFILVDHMTRYFEPRFYSAWGEFKNCGDENYGIRHHEMNQYIDKYYIVNGTGYFVPLDQNYENYYDYAKWEEDTKREFKDTKIKLLDIHVTPEDRTLNWFYVELEEGEKGLLYFWIGP